MTSAAGMGLHAYGIAFLQVQVPNIQSLRPIRFRRVLGYE